MRNNKAHQSCDKGPSERVKVSADILERYIILSEVNKIASREKTTRQNGGF